ncbi:MAG TPA: carboxypeptidase regulatory-like domain-containing protein, partial [Candidatus Angelobacter sp.]|nr:carboxypeptidase regulatory-like domain-containing protein [Candidatus Angelobacter sp.]
LVCVALILAFISTSTWAQSTATGTVSGLVSDPTGAVVAGATVTLVDLSTSTSRDTTTNGAGRYIFVNVTPGAYDVRIGKAGFAQAVLSHVSVEIGQVANANATLKIGSATETVEVTATGVEMQTMNAAIGTTVTFKAMEVLPNLSRDSSTLMTLQPAVNSTGEVAGSVRDQNTFQLDGGQNSSDMDGTQSTYTLSFAANPTTSNSTGGLTTGVVPTPVESIEEFKVATTNQTADFNGSSGGQVQMVTKRGTNAWHGALYEYYLGSNFSANFWDNNFTGTPLPSTHQNRFGGAIGGPALPSFWGGKTFFFANYEGRRFPNVSTYERSVPSDLLRAGVIQIKSGSTITAYNVNPFPVTVNGVTYAPASCNGGAPGNCDPRTIGLNPVINQLWTKFEPHANDPANTGFGDTLNTQGYKTTVGLPRNDDFGVTRIDHDFGQKWHFTSTYHYYRVVANTTDQVDVGGVVSGDALGQGSSHALRSSVASLITAGLTTNVTSNLTNDFHYSYTRNWWQWLTAAAPTQLAGLGGALEIGGESRTGSLIPMNVNTQNARQRFWDGQDNFLRDDVTLIRGNHLFQFGGSYQRNWDYHQRNDNGQGIMNAIVYQIGTTGSQGGGITISSAFQPTGLTTSQKATWNKLYAELLGMTSQPQVLYTRSGSSLSLDPLGSNMFDKVTIPSYNMYFGDTWHLKPNFTLSLGLSYTIEMPPVEENGKQVELLDGSGKLIDLANYLDTTKSMALQGKTFNPIVGFETTQNLGMKYPYNPFYGGISPRAAAAWSPNFDSGILHAIFGDHKTVIRGGYNRIYGRLNGVDLVLVPLLGTGLGQAVSCIGAVNAANAVAGNQCLGIGGSTPGTAFRIGSDGMTAPLPAVSQTLPQPFFPGLFGNPSAGDGQALDPNFRPSRSDQFDFTIQREISRKVSVEVGYIGRILKNEYQSTNLDAVPYMFTLSGQTFANAYDNMYMYLTATNGVATGIPVQPFFEAALGPGSTYCSGFTSCTLAVATKEGSAKTGAGNSQGTAVNVYNFWSDLANKAGFLFGRAMPSTLGVGGAGTPGQVSSVYLNGSWGYGNYNAAFATVRMQGWHGLTLVSNLTWSKTLGTQAVAQSTSSFTPVDAFNLHNQYGPQPFDIRLIYNTYMVWEPSWFKSQKGILGHMLGGWKFSPIFTAQSGLPLEVNVDGDCQSFGEVNCSSGATNENALLTSPYKGGNSVHYGVPGSTCTLNGQAITVGTNTKDNINIFADPASVYCQFRPPLVGLDGQTGGQGILRGLPTWNLDMSVGKEFRITERTNLKFIATFTNVLNHNQLLNPTLDITSPQTFGVIFGQANTPRQMEFGLRFAF